MQTLSVGVGRFRFHPSAIITHFGNVVTIGFKFPDGPPLVYSLSSTEFDVLLALNQGQDIGAVYENNELLPHLISFEQFRTAFEELYNSLRDAGLITKKGVPFKSKLKPKPYEKVLSEDGITSLIKSAIRSPLFFKVPIVRPVEWVDSFYPLVKWIFEPLIAGFILLVSLTTIFLFFSSTSELQNGAGIYQEFMKASNLLFIVAILVISKIPHELGHAMALRHIGGRVHEMGFGFMIFTPCLYCNVDELRFEGNKWNRFLVASAGIFVDIVVTALAAGIYLISDRTTGLANIARLTVFANIGYTVIVNLIPLTRFDGHYMLSALWGRPNLAKDSRDIVKKWANYMALSLFQNDKNSWVNKESLESDQDWLLIFGICALVYRLILTCSILGFMYNLGEAYGIGTLSLGAGILILFNGRLPVMFSWDAERKK